MTPIANKRLNDIVKESRKCSLFPRNNNEFEVNNGRATYAVKLREKKCSCRYWPISGMPYKHAALCIGYKRGIIEDFFHEFYHVKTYQKIYSGVIHPLPKYDYTTDDPSH